MLEEAGMAVIAPHDPRVARNIPGKLTSNQEIRQGARPAFATDSTSKGSAFTEHVGVPYVPLAKKKRTRAIPNANAKP
jgi:hypothetical protein